MNADYFVICGTQPLALSLRTVSVLKVSTSRLGLELLQRVVMRRLAVSPRVKAILLNWSI